MSVRVVRLLQAPQPDAVLASDMLYNLSEETSITRYPRTETSIAYEAAINN